jgi:RNA recognition motif-containing protein
MIGAAVCPGKDNIVGVFVVGKKLYVGNLSYSVDNAQLEEMFSKYGQVRSAEVIQDRDTRRSKGFGFVEMSDDNAAREAVEGLNGRETDGRALTVNEARPREERRGSGGYGGSRGGSRGSSAYSRR